MPGIPGRLAATGQDYDQRKAAKDPAQSQELSDEQDIAKISRRENYAVVYVVEDDAGQIEKLILPIRGYGLWSTLYVFIALDADANTIAGIGFYEHGETPGLGGEVDNPRWKAAWPGSTWACSSNSASTASSIRRSPNRGSPDSASAQR